jgi:hypothetical protein
MKKEHPLSCPVPGIQYFTFFLKKMQEPIRRDPYIKTEYAKISNKEEPCGQLTANLLVIPSFPVLDLALLATVGNCLAARAELGIARSAHVAILAAGALLSGHDLYLCSFLKISISPCSRGNLPNNLDGIKIVKAAPDHRFPVHRSGYAALETFSWPTMFAHKDTAHSPADVKIRIQEQTGSGIRNRLDPESGTDWIRIGFRNRLDPESGTDWIRVRIPQNA